MVDSYNWFFHRIENHELRQEGVRGEKTLVRYAAHTRQDWHDKMAQKRGFNIATINENLVAKFARQLDSQDIQAGLSKVIPNLPQCRAYHCNDPVFFPPLQPNGCPSDIHAIPIASNATPLGQPHVAGFVFVLVLPCFVLMMVHSSSSAETVTSLQICQTKGAVHVTGVALITAAPHRVHTAPLFAIGDHAPLADALAPPVTNPNRQRQPIHFSGTHHHPVRCASAATSMTSLTVKQLNYGTNQLPPTALATSMVTSSTRVATHCAGIFSGQQVVTAARTNMNVRDVATKGMEQTSAPVLSTLAACLHAKARTPYIANASAFV